MKRYFFRKKEKFATGWEPDSPDKRDAKWVRVLGVISPTAEELPHEWSWRKNMPFTLPYQDAKSECVCCSFACLQMFNSIKEGTHLTLSPRFLYAQLVNSNVGTTFRDNAQLVRKVGICENVWFPNDVELSMDDFVDEEKINEGARGNAQKYRIKNFSYVNPIELKRAIFKHPVIIAVGGTNKSWKIGNNKKHPIIEDPKKYTWYHAVLAIGWDENNNIEIANWWVKPKTSQENQWGNQGYAWLEKDYHIHSALSVEDLPDNWQEIQKLTYMLEKNNNKLIMNGDTGEFGLVEDGLIRVAKNQAERQEILLAVLVREKGVTINDAIWKSLPKTPLHP